MIDGTVPDCLTSQTVVNKDKNVMSDLEIAYTVSSPFGAGIETVSSSGRSIIVSAFSELTDGTDRWDTNVVLPYVYVETAPFLQYLTK